MSTANNVTDILKQLDSLNAGNGVSVYIPSLKKAVKFKNLNLKQQKELLKSSVDETLTKLSFITNFYSIIKENIIDNVDVTKLYSYDRTAIAIALRAHGLNKAYSSDEKTIDLEQHLKYIETIGITVPHNTTIVDDTVSLELAIPGLGYDRDVSATTITKIKNIQDRDVKVLIGELFVYEIIKFIKTITIKSTEGDNIIDFASLKIDDRVAIIEKLNSNLTSKILEYIKVYRDIEYKFNTASDGTNIEVDGSFFSI